MHLRIAAGRALLLGGGVGYTIPADALLFEDGTPYQFEDGSYVLLGE